MFSHLELGLDPPIGSDRESGCDTNFSDRQRKEAAILKANQ